MRWSRGAGVAGAVLLGVTSCSLIESQGDVVEKDDVYVLVAPEEVSEAGVGYLGTTLVLVDDCVGLEFNGGTVAVVIWPHGTSLISAQPLAIDLPGVGRVEEGDALEGGGSTYDGASPLPGVEVPSSCQGEPLRSFTPDR